MVDERTVRIVRQLRDEFPIFAEKSLKIRNKSGKVVPFKLNKAQVYVNNLIAQQKRERGYVRLLNLKSRQQGFSTLYAGRGYHNTVFNAGYVATVIAHSQKTSDELFSKVQTFQENINLPIKTIKSSAKEIVFDGLNSTYSVMTAGSKEIGRGHTINYLHASEAPFWENAEGHVAGLLQSVPSGKFIENTEVFFESTANGASGVFYNMWQEALAGQNDYAAVFVPWFMTDEYAVTPNDDFTLTADELDYKKLYKLSDAQMAWRRGKIKELGNSLETFQQEYPANATEAFLTSGTSFISPSDVIAARRYQGNIINPIGMPKIGGLDMAFSSDGDRTILAVRCGREITHIEQWTPTSEHGALVQMIMSAFERYSLDALFIDAGNGGKAVYDWLRTIAPQLATKVFPINFGGAATNSDIYHNKRAEMIDRLRQWLADAPCKIPNSDDVQSDFLAVEREIDAPRPELTLKSKQLIRKKYGKSTDILDACALLFAQPDSYIYARSAAEEVYNDYYQETVGMHGY